MPQVSVVDTSGRVYIGYATSSTPLDHGMPGPSAFVWQERADHVAGRTTSSAGFFAPASGVREVVMTNPNNNSIDLNALSPSHSDFDRTFTVDPIKATTGGGNAGIDQTEKRPDL